MDETDKKILNLLKENARIPYSEIAQKVSLSPPAVKERITKMENTRIQDRPSTDDCQFDYFQHISSRDTNLLTFF